MFLPQLVVAQLEAEYGKLSADAPYGSVAEALSKSLGEDPRRIKCAFRLSVTSPAQRDPMTSCVTAHYRKWFDNRRQTDRRPRSSSRRRSSSGSRRSTSRSNGGRAASLSPTTIGKKATQAKIKSPVKQMSRIRGGRVGYTTASMAHGGESSKEMSREPTNRAQQEESQPAYPLSKQLFGKTHLFIEGSELGQDSEPDVPVRE